MAERSTGGLGYMGKQKSLDLATTSVDGLWAATLTYVNDGPRLYFLDPSEPANRTPSRGEPAGRVRDRRVRDWRRPGHPGNGDPRSGDGEEIARLRPCSATSIRNSARDRPAPWSSTASSPPCLEFIDNTSGVEDGGGFGAEYRRTSAFDLPAFED